MPTGYTAKLVEEGQSFQEFIIGCARAFGACVTMRDDSSDTPIPEKFKPTNYHVESINKAKKTLEKLRKLNMAEQIVFGQIEKNKEIKQIQKWLKKEQKENERLEDMERQVQAWAPPTAEHQGLKDFMLQQIEISKNDTKYSKRELKSVSSYYNNAISAAENDIDYHTRENEKEIDRVNSRNEWIKQLRESVK